MGYDQERSTFNPVVCDERSHIIYFFQKFFFISLALSFPLAGEEEVCVDVLLCKLKLVLLLDSPIAHPPPPSPLVFFLHSFSGITHIAKYLTSSDQMIE